MRHTPTYSPDQDADWRALANCRDVDPDVMQPEVAAPEDVEEAKAHCAGCPVLEQCRQLALSQGDGAYGVHAGEWFGTPPRRPGVVDLIGDKLLAELFRNGWSVRRIAATYGLTKKQVEWAKGRLAA